MPRTALTPAQKATKAKLEAMEKRELIKCLLDYEERVKKEMAETRKELDEKRDEVWGLRAKLKTAEDKLKEKKDQIEDKLRLEVGKDLAHHIAQVSVAHDPACWAADGWGTCTCQAERPLEKLMESYTLL